jgi:twinkle protein
MGCGHHEPPSDDTKRRKVDTQAKDWTPISGNYQELTDRKLREETLKRWQYQVGHYKGKPTHIMNVRNEKGELVAQKYRLPGKEFRWEGDGDDLLYGMWLWGKGKSITITEGELDALSVSQAFDLKWPVVSLPNGAQSVKRTLKRCYDYLSGFDKIVLMFDMDEPGRKAVEEAALMLPAGKVFIATLPEKDANDVLKKQGPGAIVNAFWQAKPYRPDGIIRGSDLKLDDLMSATAKGFDLRCPDLNNKLLGLRKAEITLFTAGSGIGKSTLVRQLMYELHEDHPELKFGNIFLEENNKKTAQAYIALDNKVPLGKLRYLFDTESNGFVANATKLHCIAGVDVDTKECLDWKPDGISQAVETIDKADVLIGHNIQRHDIPLMTKLTGWRPRDGVIIRDTMICADCNTRT